MKLPVLILLGLALAPLGGCIGAPGPLASSADPARSPRTVRVPTTLTGGSAQASSLILGVQ